MPMLYALRSLVALECWDGNIIKEGGSCYSLDILYSRVTGMAAIYPALAEKEVPFLDSEYTGTMFWLRAAVATRIKVSWTLAPAFVASLCLRPVAQCCLFTRLR